MTDFTPCRTLGHAWDEVPSTWRPDNGLAVITLRCTRCTTTREDVISRLSGGLYGRYYTYPEGYKDAEKMNKDAWRKQYLKKTKRPNMRRTA